MTMLTIQYLQHSEIASLDSHERIDKLLDFVKHNKIVLLEGRLRKHEETDLIQKTMESITPKFKGIEIATITPSQTTALLDKLKANILNLLLGDRQGMTIIGPATIVKEIKQDPTKIQLLLSDSKKR